MVKLTVICPFYNEEKYIAQCMDSIVKQDFPQNELQVLLVDGGSSDRSRSIAEEYCAKYSFLRVLDNPDRIVPAAMNLAIDQAQGDVILRLDMHASYAPNYFSALVSRLEELHAENVGCPWETDVLNKTPISLAIREVLRNRLGVGNATFRLGSQEVKEVDTVPFGCFPQSVFEKYGKYDVRLVRNQDIEFNKRIARNGGKIYLVPDTSCTYYARETYSALAKNNFLNGKWNIWTVFYTKAFRSLSLRHFVPLLFLCSLILPLLLGLYVPQLVGISALSLGLYFCCVSVEVGRLCVRKHLNFIYLLIAFVTLHISYGVGSLVGILSLPFLKR